MDINSAVGRQRGLSDDKLLDLGRYEQSAAYSEVERLVLRLTDGMSATPANVSAELFAQLRARFNRVFDVGSQGFAAGHVCVLPATRP